MGQTNRMEANAVIGERLVELQVQLVALADALCAATQSSVTASEDAASIFREEHTAGIDQVVLSARQVDSLLARQIALLDRETSNATEGLFRRGAEEKQPSFKWSRLFGNVSGRHIALSEDQVGLRLSELIGASHALLVHLQNHQAIISNQLTRLESAVIVEMAKLNALAITADPEPANSLLAVHIELLEDCVDALVGMAQVTNVFVNKLQLDAEERILFLHGLCRPDIAKLVNDWPCFRSLLERVERGLLSTAGLRQRKLHLNEAFQRHAAHSRQAVSG